MVDNISAIEGYGTGKRCVIVGGGLSRADFMLSNVSSNIDIISCNSHALECANIVIYHDKGAGDKIQRSIVTPPILLGPEQWYKYHDKCTHRYLASDITAGGDVDFGDTGYHALQIADKILCYNEIYLCGLDYCDDGESYHWDEISSNPQMLDKFRRHSCGIVLNKMLDYKPKHAVYRVADAGRLKYPVRSLDDTV